jgi:hypothetical protein
VPKSGMVELYLHSPIYLQDTVLNELSTGKILKGDKIVRVLN